MGRDECAANVRRCDRERGGEADGAEDRNIDRKPERGDSDDPRKGRRAVGIGGARVREALDEHDRHEERVGGDSEGRHPQRAAVRGNVAIVEQRAEPSDVGVVCTVGVRVVSVVLCQLCFDDSNEVDGHQSTHRWRQR